MPQFLVALYRPLDYDPASEDDAMARAIDALNAAMNTQGVRVFVGGLSSPDSARTVIAHDAGDTIVTPGLHGVPAEHIGGFWVLEVADLDAALTWGRKASLACRAPVEVRAFL